MKPTFIHLHLHSEYSIIDGIVRHDELISLAAKQNMPAVAVTDHVNLFGMVKFYQAAMAQGIKPIIGVDLKIAGEKATTHHLILLCQNEQGYKNLTRLISRAYTEGQQTNEPLIDPRWLTSESVQGLIALCGGIKSDISQALMAKQDVVAETHLQKWLALFSDRFYIELQRVGRAEEEILIQKTLNLCAKHKVPVVATNAVRFLDAEDFEAHEARVCINQGCVLQDERRVREYTELQYFKTTQEMIALFADIPSAITNTVEIAKRCNLELKMGVSFLPIFPVPETMTTEVYFAKEANDGLNKRLQETFDINADDFAEKRSVYEERLQLELSVINKMGFAGYFLIVADFIRWSLENHIPVGPGRGSGAGSLVAYALGITGLDPLQHELLFERFLNPERVSMPDFDIDFCMEGRDRVIDYVAKRYGRNNVSQIITFGTMAARAVVRDVGRVLGHPYGMIDKIAKLIPAEIGITLDKALEQEALLQQQYDDDAEVRNLLDLARKLEGIVRNAGKHAGGVVIAPSALTDFVPLYCEAESESLISQFDKDDVEAIGLVKFDFLGLRTLTIIDWALRTINAKREANAAIVDINLIPTDDEATYQLLKNCETTAVFQLESRGMKDLIKRLQPDCFDEIVALVALFRPGPLQSGMVDDFIDRKHGRATVEYFHPVLQTILKPTYGIILYQEQVMQIAQVLAGYSLGAADLLRRAMGKKKPEEMAKQREFFITGAKNNQVDPKLAEHIFDLMEKFAGYGFNKSHSAAYALVSYQTAWLKTHYPAAFMAAVLSSDMDNTDKVVGLIEECKRMQLTLKNPDINSGFYHFTVDDENNILFGLGAIKGVGQAAIEQLVATRTRDGAFKNIFEFCERMDGQRLNRRLLDSLIRSGAMDGLQAHRASLLATVDLALQASVQQAKRKANKQQDLFSGSAQGESTLKVFDCPPLTPQERLQGEKETLGYYLSGHPLDRYDKELAHFITDPLSKLQPGRSQTVMIAGMIMTIRTMMTKRQERMAFITLDDRTARIEVAVFPENYQKYREILVKDQILIVEGEVSIDEYSGGFRLSARKLMTIEQKRVEQARHLVITLKDYKINAALLTQIKDTIDPYNQGSCPVVVNYHKENIIAQLNLGNNWRVKPADELINQLQLLCGEEEVAIEY
jgi:DNA polymerase-3 subunit alpha